MNRGSTLYPILPSSQALANSVIHLRSLPLQQVAALDCVTDDANPNCVPDIEWIGEGPPRWPICNASLGGI